MNLPGRANYNPSKPWVFKVRADGSMAADLFIYTDDLRLTGPTSEECWRACHQLGCKLTWFGLQDAAHKRRAPSMEPGAWAGSIIHASNGAVCVSVSQEKWDKTKQWINWMEDIIDNSSKFPHKELRNAVAF